ncbi:gamma-glutamyltransferase [Shewanella dokdonensis]|uniref:Gamma-glutamyltransferase n=2 Tax=Shewanella dokdonensis TaxID=712036 RepID=A0ABX8DJI2_9GAMM|nr:gamma-glutamyltransferase [Shewanella dokdonensis]
MTVEVSVQSKVLTIPNYGAAVAPHQDAAASALRVLQDGGNAVEAMVAAAATIAVVYPHMNSIGGDGFWLIAAPGQAPVAIEACGVAAALADIQFYQQQGLKQVPVRGPLAANTVAGTVSGWQLALDYSQQSLSGHGNLSLARLLDDAIRFAQQGSTVTTGLARCLLAKQQELGQFSAFSQLYMPQQQPLPSGALFQQPALARSLTLLAQNGLDDFYRGELAALIATELAQAGSPLRLADLQQFHARQVVPLALELPSGTVYNLPPPSQGLVSLLILGLLSQPHLSGCRDDETAFIHQVVEATKQAFDVRDRCITDPDYMSVAPQSLLSHSALAELASRISMTSARPWNKGKGPADTIWMGVVDRHGVAVSFIQSIYHEFGSGLILPQSGITWQNRGSSFSLDPAALNPLMPGRRPFHTLNPALARLNDGSVMPYGSMGGDGQPQTQAIVFERIINRGMSPQDAIAAPRWLLGRTWGQTSDTLKLENRVAASTLEHLRALGHDLEIYPPYDDMMGHAGAIRRFSSGAVEAGYDPRSDGGVALA